MHPIPVLTTPFPALTTFFPVYVFPSIEVPGNPSSCFLISCFTVSLTPSINMSPFFINFLILIIWSTSLFKMTKMIHFPGLTTSYQCIFLWIVPSIQTDTTRTINVDWISILCRYVKNKISTNFRNISTHVSDEISMGIEMKLFRLTMFNLISMGKISMLLWRTVLT